MLAPASAFSSLVLSHGELDGATTAPKFVMVNEISCEASKITCSILCAQGCADLIIFIRPSTGSLIHVISSCRQARSRALQPWFCTIKHVISVIPQAKVYFYLVNDFNTELFKLITLWSFHSFLVAVHPAFRALHYLWPIFSVMWSSLLLGLKYLISSAIQASLHKWQTF